MEYQKNQDSGYKSCYDRFVNGKSKKIYLGTYLTPEEAFEVYKVHKGAYIKEVAEQYKNQIPERLYIAMMKYEVEITD